MTDMVMACSCPSVTTTDGVTLTMVRDRHCPKHGDDSNSNAKCPASRAHADAELSEEYERAKNDAQESCMGAHNSYGCGYDSGYREGIRFALYRGKADGK